MVRPGDSQFGKLQVDWKSWKDLQRALRHAADDELPKRVGRANRSIGKFIKRYVDAESDPTAVGVGRGSDVRPSSSKRAVLLRVGGSHRAVGDFSQVRKQPWGVRSGRRPGQRAPDRPYILRITEEHRDEIEREWLNAIGAAMQGAFADVDV